MAKIAGVISLSHVLKEQGWIRQWAGVPVASLGLMSAAGLLGKAIPTHNTWRVVVVWSVLLIPFTAHWILQQGQIDWKAKRERFLSYSTATVTSTLVFVLALFAWNIYFMTRQSAFSREDRAAGQFLETRFQTQRASSGASKVLIDTADWSYFNVVIASQHPGAFLYNSGPDPYQPEPPILNPEAAIKASTLREKQIGLLVFRNPFYKVILDRSPEVTRIKDFGDWAIYEPSR